MAQLNPDAATSVVLFARNALKTSEDDAPNQFDVAKLLVEALAMTCSSGRAPEGAFDDLVEHGRRFYEHCKLVRAGKVPA